MIPIILSLPSPYCDSLQVQVDSSFDPDPCALAVGPLNPPPPCHLSASLDLCPPPSSFMASVCINVFLVSPSLLYCTCLVERLGARWVRFEAWVRVVRLWLILFLGKTLHGNLTLPGTLAGMWEEG